MDVYDLASPVTTGGTRWVEDTLITPEPWVQDGLCTQVDPDLFFPDKADWSKAALAKSICAECPVIDLCLDYALRTDQKFGVWGGKTTYERARLRGDAPRQAPKLREQCKNGHAFTVENTQNATYKAKDGTTRTRRKCRECNRNRDRGRAS